MRDAVDVPVEGVRILVDQQGGLRKLLRIAWSDADASIFLIPYVPGRGIVYGGIASTPDPGTPHTFSFDGQLCGDWGKVSLHQSGRVHATVRSAGELIRSPPITALPLDHLADGQVATVSCFNPEGLPEVLDAQGPPDTDLVLTSNDVDWTATQIPIFVTSDPNRFEDHHFRLCFRRATLKSPLYVTLRPRSESHPPENREGGISILAWGLAGPTSSSDLVFVVTAPSGQPNRS